MESKVRLFLKIIIGAFVVSIAPLFAQKTIHVNSIDQLLELEKQETKHKSIDLHINRIKLFSQRDKKIMSSLSRWKNLSAIRSITFQDIGQISGKILTWFLTNIPDSQLVSLKITNVKIKWEFQLPSSRVYSQLEKISIIKTDLDEDFFENFNITNLPNLRHLELVSCDLDEDYIPLLRDSQLLGKIEYLDLSQNDFENSVFSIFPFQKQGNLQTLKLNQCEILLDKDEDYSSEFLAVNKNIAKTEYFVDWDSPFFSKLRHLEIQNKTKEIEEIRTFLTTKKFHNLNVFFGFLLKLDKAAYEKEELQNKRKEKEYLELISSYPLKSVRNNFPFESPVQLNIFLKSAQAIISENIILSGDRWNYIAVKTLLASNKLPALKELSVINTTLTQNKVKGLIDEFGHISINAIFRDQGEHWPGITK